MQLNFSQQQNLLNRFPEFELSYETVSHKKVCAAAVSVAVAVPHGKKYFLWTTFLDSTPATYLLELDRDRRVCRATHMHSVKAAPGHQYGVVLYGTVLGSVAQPANGAANSSANSAFSHSVFLADDIYQYKGVDLGHLGWGDRCGFLRDCMRDLAENAGTNRFHVAIPVMWPVPAGAKYSDAHINPITNLPAVDPGYNVHHIQYRETERVAPYLNVIVSKKPLPINSLESVEATVVPGTFAPPNFAPTLAPTLVSDTVVPGTLSPNLSHTLSATPESQVSESTKHVLAKMMQPPQVPRFAFGNSQFKLPTVFIATADMQFDIYYLHATKSNHAGKVSYGPLSGPSGSGSGSTSTSGSVCVGIAGIPSYRTSRMMNAIFRRIRENANLDFIEESEDEAEFENTDETKFVDLNLAVPIECVFNSKFNKWEPVRQAAETSQVVHIGKLTAPDHAPHHARPNNYNKPQNNNNNRNYAPRHANNPNQPQNNNRNYAPRHANNQNSNHNQPQNPNRKYISQQTQVPNRNYASNHSSHNASHSQNNPPRQPI